MSFRAAVVLALLLFRGTSAAALGTDEPLTFFTPRSAGAWSERLWPGFEAVEGRFHGAGAPVLELRAAGDEVAPPVRLTRSGVHAVRLAGRDLVVNVPFPAGPTVSAGMSFPATQPDVWAQLFGSDAPGPLRTLVRGLRLVAPAPREIDLDRLFHPVTLAYLAGTPEEFFPYTSFVRADPQVAADGGLPQGCRREGGCLAWGEARFQLWRFHTDGGGSSGQEEGFVLLDRASRTWCPVYWLRSYDYSVVGLLSRDGVLVLQQSEGYGVARSFWRLDPEAGLVPLPMPWADLRAVRARLRARSLERAGLSRASPDSYGLYTFGSVVAVRPRWLGSGFDVDWRMAVRIDRAPPAPRELRYAYDVTTRVEAERAATTQLRELPATEAP